LAHSDEPWPATPHETGSWSSHSGTWIPQQRGADRPDYTIERFEDSGDLRRLRPGDGQVLDHDDWYEGPAGRKTGRRPVAHPTQPTPVTRPAGPTDPNIRRPALWSQSGDLPQRQNAPDWSALGESARTQPRLTEPPSPWRPTTAVYRTDPARLTPSTVDSEADLELAPYGERATAEPEPDGDDPPPGGYLVAVLATLGWYAIPAVLYVAGTLLLGGTPRASCVTDSGAPCASPRSQALHEIVNNLPWLTIALLLSVLVALLIRWASAGWRAVTVGFSAAVVGAGVITVLHGVLVGSG
jgi:hypothetical protein